MKRECKENSQILFSLKRFIKEIKRYYWETKKKIVQDHCQTIYFENWRGDSRLNSISSVAVTRWQNYNQLLVYCCLLIHRIVSNYFVETKSIRQTPDPDRTNPENLAFPLYFLSSISFADHTNRNRSLRFTNDRFRIIGSTITRIVDEFRVSIRTIRFISSFFQNVFIIMLFVVRYALFNTRHIYFFCFCKISILINVGSLHLEMIFNFLIL